MTRPPLFLLAAACLRLIFVGSQAPGLTQQEPVAETRTIPLAVYDSKGQFMTGLKLEQIRVKGLPAVVRRIQFDASPRKIILLLDASGSMGRSRGVPWQNVVRVAKQILAVLPPNDPVAAYAFSDEPQILSPLTTEREFLVRQIDSFSAWGKGLTRLGSALAGVLASHQAEFKVGDLILCLSDGFEAPDFGRQREDLLATFQKMGVRFYFVRVVPESESRESIDAFRSFARATGGTSIVPELFALVPRADPPRQFLGVSALEPKNVERMSLWIHDLLQAVYSVQLEFPRPLTKPGDLKLEVVDSNGGKIKSTVLYYPQRLTPVRTDRQ